MFKNMITIIGSILNLFAEDLNDHLMSTRILSLIINKIFVYMRSKNYEKRGYSLSLEMLTI